MTSSPQEDGGNNCFDSGGLYCGKPCWGEVICGGLFFSLIGNHLRFSSLHSSRKICLLILTTYHDVSFQGLTKTLALSMITVFSS